MATKNRFQIVKSVGSPSVSGAERVETLSNHTNNPEAHPDYMKKGAIPAIFDGGDHLTSKLCHAIYYARRAELCVSKSDYDLTKSVSYSNNSDNYMLTSSVKRHIVTTYVLAQVLSSLGLDGTKKYIETNKIVGTTSTPPSTSIDSYVVSYGLYKRVKDQIDYWLGDSGIDATYLRKTDAASTYVTLTTFNAHVHDCMDILGMPSIMNYIVTNDTTYLEGKSYYAYNTSTHVMDLMVAGEDYIEGDPITGNVFEDITASLGTMPTRLDTAETNIANLQGVSGYARTCDAKYLDNIVYYEYDSSTKTMKKLIAGTDYTIDTDIPSSKKLWVQVRNFNPDTIEPYDDAWIVAKSGYALTTDTTWVSGVTYYKYDADSHTMIKVTDGTGTPVGRGLWCQISNNISDARIGYVLTTDTTRITGVTYYRYESGTMVVDTTSASLSGLWVKNWNWRYDDRELAAKAGYALTTDTTAITGTTYYQYDSSSHAMVAAAPSNPAEEGCYVKVGTKVSTYDDSEWIAKDGYARTADTTVVSGTQYYKYDSSAKAMNTYTPATGANPYDLGLYVLVKTDTGGGGSAYDDTAIKKELKKLGYVLTTDTSAVSGVQYYYVNSSTGAMQAYTTAPSNPASVNAWVKNYNWRYSYDDTEVKAKAGYALTADESAVSGVTYYYYLGGYMFPYSTAPANPASVGAWCKIKNSSGGGGSGYDDTELRNRISKLESHTENNFRPDWTSTTSLSLTRTASTNIWTTSEIPMGSDDESITGTIFISACIVLDASTYCQVQVMDACSADWTQIQNCLSFHTYCNSSTNHVSRINFSAHCGSGDQFRIVVKTKSTNTDAKYSANYKEYVYAPTTVRFTPDYQ